MSDSRPQPLIAWVMTGALLGTALAMLLAPLEGSGGASEFYGRGKNLIDEARQGLDEPGLFT